MTIRPIKAITFDFWRTLFLTSSNQKEGTNESVCKTTGRLLESSQSKRKRFRSLAGVPARFGKIVQTRPLGNRISWRRGG